LKKVKFIFNAGIVALFLLTAAAAFGQETQEKVVDEVVAQVGNGVITLSRVKREMKNIVDSQVQQGKDKAAAEKAVEEKKGELIANLINEELMIDKAKEYGIEKDAENEVNQRFLQVMKQYGLKTVDALYKEMEKAGSDPKEIRDMWLRQAIRDMLIQREVHQRLYWEPTATQVKDYFEKNKSKFATPESVTLSEIFLAFAGRDEAAVRQKAKQLVTQLRGGADFQKLAVENSDKPDVATTKGKVDTFDVKELDPKFANAIKGLNKGSVTEPVDIEDIGVSILHVDERTAASAESQFDERKIRTAMMYEKAPAKQKEFLAKLREGSYIKINDTYRPLVAPVLFEDERKEKTANKINR